MTKIILMLVPCLAPQINFMHLSYIIILASMLIMLMLMKTPPFQAATSIMMMDPMSMTLIILSTLSTILIIMSINLTKKSKTKLIMIMLILVMAFSASKTIMFYIMFEMVLIPTLMLITSMGGQPERLQAGMYLIMYTIVASLPLLLGMLFFKSCESMFNSISLMKKINIPMIFLLAFLAKTPMFITHLWLPKAHVEAPLEGSMILAAVLLKLGGYGLIRFIPLMYSFMKSIPHWILSISIFGAIYTSMGCIRQKDLKALIAYSSVAHMAVTMSSIFIFFNFSVNGAIIMMIAHGISSSALFFLVNMTYTKFHTRSIISLKSNFSSHPNLTFWWFMFAMANISAPPTLNLMGELLMTMGLIKWHPVYMLILTMVMLATTSFCILMFIMMNHGASAMKFSENDHTKFFLSLGVHLLLIMSITLKMEFMFL